jgi:hypothetical protein
MDMPPVNEASDLEEMEVDSSHSKVIVTLANLTAPQIALIMAQNPEIYWPFADISQHYRVDLTPFFSLRGHDLPPTRPEWMLHRGRQQCVFGFWDDDGMQEGTFVGDRLAPDPDNKNRAAPQNAVSEATPSKKKKDNKGKGKSSLPAPTVPFQKVKNDGVKVAFHLQSQTPSIELCVKTSAVPGEKMLMSTRFFAEDLACRPSGQAQICIRPSEGCPLTDAELQSKIVIGGGGNASTSELKRLAANNQMAEIVFKLKERKRRVWSGLPPAEIDAIRSRTPAQSREENTLSRDLTVQNLDNCQLVSIYLRYKDLEAIQIAQKMCAYMVDLFSLCAKLGNFWFYRGLMVHNGEQPDAIERPELPRINYITPRWLVKSWQFDETRTNQGVSWANPVAYSWASFRELNEYRNPNEAAFLLKLGILGEQQRQTRDLYGLVESGDNVWFRGVFRSVPDERGTYFVETFMGDVLGSVKMPDVGTRVSIKIDLNNPWEPNQLDAVEYRGQVTFDLFQHGASFTCVVKGPTFKNFNEGEEYPIFISYLIDTAVYDKKMIAVTKIQAIDSDNKREGIDTKAIVLGCAKPAPNPGSLAAGTDSEGLAKVDSYISSLRKRPNADQKGAIVDAVTSQSGATLILGPPGCGKSFTLVTIGKCHELLGRKVMFAAPQNEAIRQLFDTFDKAARSAGTYQPSEYVIFSGAFIKVTAAERFRVKQELIARQSVSPAEADQVLDASAEGENILVEFARSADSHTIPESYQHTYGYQLKCMIDHWAQMPVVPTMTAADDLVRDQASQYLELCRKVKLLTDRNQREICVKDINILEYNLGLHYLRNNVKFVFCTISSSAHPVLVEGFEFPELIIDEVAHESSAGIATIFGAFAHCVKHVTLCGDHKQLKAVYIAQDSNVGHSMLSRNLFRDMIEDPRGRYNTFLLNECYRMRPEHLKFTSGFYSNELKPSHHCAQFDQPLQNSLQAYWSQQLRASFGGSKFSIAQDVSGMDCKMSNLAGTTTKYNPVEAEILSWRLKDMISWVPPQNTPGKIYRPIVAGDFIVISAYTGQIQEIRRKLKATLPGQQYVDTADVLLVTTNQSQGKERNIAMISLVINMGGKRVLPTEPYPITFVAEDRSINVMLSRQRVGRYIFGDLRTMVQMKVDGNEIAGRYSKFFGLLRNLRDNDTIVSMEELALWRNSLLKPEDRELDFAHHIQRKEQYPRRQVEAYNPADGDRPQMDEPVHASDFQGPRNVGTTGVGASTAAEPQGIHFAGDRDNQGVLRSQGSRVSAPTNQAGRGNNRVNKHRNDNKRGRGRGGRDGRDGRG